MSAYLLTATLLVCTAPLLAQDHSVTPLDSTRIAAQQASLETLPAISADASARKDGPSRGDVLTKLLTQPGFVTSDGLFLDDRVCYTMRSYVVARDSKDSDSVHPVGYSTCQRAGKYRLRTTEQTTIGSTKR